MSFVSIAAIVSASILNLPATSRFASTVIVNASAPGFAASVLGAALIWIALHCWQTKDEGRETRSALAAVVICVWPRIMIDQC